MSSKRPPTLKQWLKIGSVAFGVSCVWTLPFTLNLGQSALIGLATMPGLAAGMMLRSRPHRQGQRQQEQGKLRLQELQHQSAILDRQLQLRFKDRQEIELKVSQLHDLVANLTDRIDRDKNRHQQLEQQLATLTLHCQTQEDTAANLDRRIHHKQAYLLEVNTSINSLKLELAQVQSTQAQIKDVNLADTFTLEQQKILLADIHHHINICLNTQQELELQIQQLQDRKVLENEDFDRLVIEHSRSDLQEQSDPNENELAPLSDRLLQRELRIAQLELSSRQAELDNLEFKLHSKLQSIDEINLEKSIHSFEPQPPIIDRDVDAVITAGTWSDKFINNPHLTVLKHIEKHGAITEAEASSKLGNARSVRQFANKLEEYTQDLPFSIRVESSPKGNRYLREDRN